ncbi:MAG: enoyl-CoA hydratase [Gammaproteobacteria bacterium]
MRGREGIFSAGFDLKLLARLAFHAKELTRVGAETARRIVEFPFPVVVACTGHAFPMGAFLLLAPDYRIGVTGTYKIGLNEVSIGITVPRFAIELG